MPDYTPNVVERLKADPRLHSLLPKYGSDPAVFSDRPVPPDATYPLIVSEGASSFGAFSADALRGTRETRDIVIFDQAFKGSHMIDMIAQAVRERFTWNSLAIPGFRNILSDAFPFVRNDDEVYNGRVVRLNLFESTVTTGSVGFVDYEIPSETPNGSITNFSTSRAYISGSLMVFANYPQRPGTDFTEDSDLNGFTFVSAPMTGTDLWCAYRFEQS